MQWCKESQAVRPLVPLYLAVLLNLFALITTGIKYNETKGFQEDFVFRRNIVYGKITELGSSNEGINDSQKRKGYGERELKRYIYLAVCMILFLSFAVVVLVGCWKFLGD